MPGTGRCIINGKTSEEYFSPAQHMHATEALRVTETEGMYDFDVTVHGGGVSGQAGAMRLGIARALEKEDPTRRQQLKPAGLLRRDDREKESKKAGLKKARKAPQYSKR